jgi:hypothetical protein
MSRFSWNRFFSLLLSCSYLGGCAIHPLPENVTGVKTSQIVHRNRCEAKAAVLKIEKWLRANHKSEALRALPTIGMALSYTLDMTETDGLTASSSFEQLVTRGTFSANPGAADALTRENKRTFTVADNYRTLTQMVDCDPAPAGANYQYPIVGTIGIDETIRTFLTMALHENLNGPIEDQLGKLPDDPTKYTAASPSMVETLTFTTKISAGVTPQIMLTPVLSSSQLKLNSASLAFAWSRQDMHEVIVGLGMPTVRSEDGHVRTLYSAISSSQGAAARARTPLLIEALVPNDSAGPASGVSIALEAVNNQVVRFEAPRRTVVLAQ